ncbi:hypothetical protein BDZ89DRAFT_467813 [Hymenopellis radicata]|nr:hypothetical protein BDZ89DRAFT_467813 [Hymenopellis radicata]
MMRMIRPRDTHANVCPQNLLKIGLKSATFQAPNLLKRTVTVTKRDVHVIFLAQMFQILPQQQGTVFFTGGSAFWHRFQAFHLQISSCQWAISSGQRPWSSNLLTWDSVIEFRASNLLKLDSEIDFFAPSNLLSADKHWRECPGACMIPAVS